MSSLPTSTAWTLNIKFTTEPEQDDRLPFLDACVNINEDGSTHVKVYRKPTHTDQYLNFSSNHHPQHKRSVVRTLMTRAEVMVTRPDCRRKEMAHVQDAGPRPKQQQSTTPTETRPKGPATRNDFVNDIVDDARADAIFATLIVDDIVDDIVTCGRALRLMVACVHAGHLRGTHTCVQSTWSGHLPSAHQHHSIHPGTS